MIPERPGMRINLIDSKIPKQGEAKGFLSYFSPENQERYNKLSEKAKEIAMKAYEGFGKIRIPGVGGKLGIAYNQFWLDKYQKNTVDLKTEMDDLDLDIGELDDSKTKIEAAIENLKKQGVPGAESLEIKLKVLGYKRMEFLNEKDQIQSKFEFMDNKKKLCTNKRDRIAGKLIERYDEKIKPMEEEIERLKTSRDEIELLLAVAKVNHSELLKKIGDIEQSKKQVEEALLSTGMSVKEIAKFRTVKILQNMITEIREKIRQEKEELERKKEEIDQKIANADAEANPYRDKREQFVRIRENRPLQVEIDPRQRSPEFTETEEIRTNPRGEAGESPYALDKSKRETKETPEGDSFWKRDTLSHLEEPIQKPQEAKEGKEEMRRPVYEHIINWNNMVDDKYGRSEIISLEDFLKMTKLSKEYVMNLQNFGKILEKYYKLKKIQIEKFKEIMTILGT